MPAGRPTKMTPGVIALLEEAFEWGCPDVEACLHAGINPVTLYRYQEEHPEYCKRKEALKKNPSLKARRTVFNSLDNPQDAKWYLEHKEKDEFSTQINKKIGNDNTGTLNINHTVTPEEALKERGIPLPGVELEDVE